MLDRVAAGWALAGGLVLFAVVAVTMVNIAGIAADRVAGLFGGTAPRLAGFEELAGLLTGVGVVMLLPYCQVRRGHVVVDLFLRWTPAGFSNQMDRICAALFALVALFLAVMLARGAWEGAADGVTTSVLGLPDWPFQMPAIASLLLWSVIAARQGAGVAGMPAEDR